MFSIRNVVLFNDEAIFLQQNQFILHGKDY